MLPVVISFLGVLLWGVNTCLEWSIPPRCQAIIEAWKKGLSRKTRSLNIVWDSWPREEDLEKDLWLLKKELFQLRRKFKAPFWIEVQVGQSVDERQNEKYLSCLQRRFPEIEITMYPLYGEGHGTCGDT
jgi:hypothetical protein